MLDASRLHVFTARSNPLGWVAPHRNWVRFARHMVESGVVLTVVECAYGEAPFECEMDGVRHIGVRAKTRGWNKENLLNLGIQRTPEAKYIAWIDADVIFRRDDWAEATVKALQHYDIVQPWSDAYDLGPNDDHIAHHRSFCRQYFYRNPLVATTSGYWQGDGGPYIYPHSGYAWAATRDALDWVGGLFEVGGMGSGDHHMALSLIGQADKSMPDGTTAAYRAEVKRWESRALRHINGNIGFVPGTIEHLFHGRKGDRGYQSRWEMFVNHAFDPYEDLKRNTHGVLEFATNKPELRHDFDLYLHSRNEDANAA
jgi:Glycosyl transferase family 2